jgi:hypothetical protein
MEAKLAQAGGCPQGGLFRPTHPRYASRPTHTNRVPCSQSEAAAPTPTASLTSVGAPSMLPWMTCAHMAAVAGSVSFFIAIALAKSGM